MLLYDRNIIGAFSEIFGKCQKNVRKRSLVNMNFIFSCSTRHLTSELRSLVRYRVEHSKIKFISTRGHVISSILTAGYMLGFSFALSVLLGLEPPRDWKRNGKWKEAYFSRLGNLILNVTRILDFHKTKPLG